MQAPFIRNGISVVMPSALCALFGTLGILAFACALHPEIRATCLLLGLLLWTLAIATRRNKIRHPPVIVLSLIFSLAYFSFTLVGFARQLRAQRNLTNPEKRAQFLSYQVGLRWPEIQQIQSSIPEDAHVLLLWNANTSVHTRSLMNYYLMPRRLHHWLPEKGYQVDESGNLVLPELAWMQEHKITWLVILEGEKGNRLRALPYTQR